jgi:dTDP-4-amino-4,6-dideoxygalactose transaminase
MELIPLVKTNMPREDILIPRLKEVLYSGYVAQGDSVDEFEQSFEHYIGKGKALTVNSGTAALHIALDLIGVSEGDEVISTALTAEPTNIAIKMAGGKIRYADIDYNTGNISAQSIRDSINENTKSIMIVDYAGIPVNVRAIQQISDDFSIPVIHDAAHSIGSKYDGKVAGNHFPYTAFSFQAIKHITTVDGGMLHLKSESEYEKGKLIRWFGLDKSKTRFENNITTLGYKYHMNNVNATLGIIQLETIQDTISKHIENGKYFDKMLADVPGIETLEYYTNTEPSYWLYTLKVENREGFIAKLKENGIMASELHKRNDHHSLLNDFPTELPNLNKFYERLVHIPCGWWVKKEDRERIVNIISSGW